MNRQLLLSLVNKWRKEAELRDDWIHNCSRWFSSLSEDKKNKWRHDSALATGIRGCANELDQLLKEMPVELEHPTQV